MLDSEPTEPLSVDGNSSELEMEDLEEEESQKKTEICCSVPNTPDQEAFLNKNFANLSDFSTSGLFLSVCGRNFLIDAVISLIIQIFLFLW